MLAAHLRRVLREPEWLVLLCALLIGAALGRHLARETSEAASAVLGRAWQGSPKETRSVLASLFGLQLIRASLEKGLPS